MKHPNTVAATVAGGGAAVVIYLAELAGVALPAWAAAPIATGAITVILFVGRNGLAGVKDAVLHGIGKT